MRLFIAKIEVVGGLLLLVLCVSHFGWCQWSVPRHGQQTAHGLETAACNWGTALAAMIFGLFAVFMLASGLIGYRVRARTFAWYASQLPAMAGWAWILYALVFSFAGYPG